MGKPTGSPGKLERAAFPQYGPFPASPCRRAVNQKDKEFVVGLFGSAEVRKFDLTLLRVRAALWQLFALAHLEFRTRPFLFDDHDMPLVNRVQGQSLEMSADLLGLQALQPRHQSVLH